MIKNFIIKNKKESIELSICIEDDLLIITINNSQISSYTYDELVDFNKKFKAFHSIEDIYSFIISFIEKEEIQIINKRKLILKEWDITIPLVHHSTVNNLLNLLFLHLNSPELKVIKNIRNSYEIYSMCLLKDGRLVSGGESRIVVYKKYTYQPYINIKDGDVYSIYVLKNGNLAACGRCDDINIYLIGENNYKHIHTLKRHNDRVKKVIETADGKLYSCSYDGTILIWDNNYKPILASKEHINGVASIIEMNEYVVSVGNQDDNNVRIWNKQKTIKVIPQIYCCGRNSLSKLKENTVILGGSNILFILDISNFKSKSFKDKELGNIWSICVLREDRILLGNEKGKIVCYDSLSNEIIFTQKVHSKDVSCIIKSEDNKVLSSSEDGVIYIFEYSI